MKMKILIVAILAIIPALQVVRADSLVPDSISVTGNIIQRTGTNGATLGFCRSPLRMCSKCLA